MNLRRPIMMGMLVLLTIGTAMAQSPAPPARSAPAAGNPSEALSPEEAAARALEMCIDHSLGTALIAPAAAQQLASKGFRLSDERSPSEVGSYSGQTVIASTTKGVVKAYASQRGYCEVTASGSPSAPIEMALMAIFERPKTFDPQPSTADLPDVYLKRFLWHWSRPGQDFNAWMYVRRDNSVSARIIKSAELP